ncbi:MAG: methionine--tRNA ligase [Candidatus Cloacimonetes bacterium]|nr:methionine--tRNA ligase [Candidatus Cloacimonadota bacterium]
MTTPIYYVNGDPHIGTAFTTLIADTLARFRRSLGEEVRFTTGTDEHALKVYELALQNNRTPLEHTDIYSRRFMDAWEKLDIQYDDFIRTTEERHKVMVTACVQKLMDKGIVYKGLYKGWYCKWDETFYPESKVDPERIKPDAARPLQYIEEENYFFRLSAFNQALLNHYATHPDFVLPGFRRNEMIAILEQGLEDISISRIGGKWGIPMPNDANHVIYVWIEALMNYLTSAGYLQDETLYKTFWPAAVQVVGKDILKFHAIIWPAILMALELPLPATVLTHGFILVDGQKMSKSLGNVQDPLDLAKTFGSDALRFAILREISIGQDGNFDAHILSKRYHSELGNDLGNLVQRLLSIAKKHLNGEIQKPQVLSLNLKDRFVEQIEKVYLNQMDKLVLNGALETLWAEVKNLNRVVDEQKPWALAKDDNKEPLSHLLWELFDAIRALSHALYPFIPKTSALLLSILDQEHKPAFSRARIGMLPEVMKLVDIPILFPRIEEEQPKTTVPVKPKQDCISIEDFQKIKMELVTVLEAKHHPDAEKLLVLTLSTSGGKKQVVSGIAAHYRPEDILGKQVVFVKNLQPVELRGVSSEGMILAASNKKELSLISVDKPIQEGSKVS